MKAKNKLLPAIILVGIVSTLSVNSQTLGYIPKWNGSAYVNTATPIFESGTNIGIGTTAPGHKLDVNGNTNINSGSAYKIGGNNVISHNGVFTNIYVGVNAGAALGGNSNVFVGYSAGFNNVASGNVENAYIGANAGYNFSGTQNTFLGAYAGYGSASGASGIDDTYLGFLSGYSTTTGSDNTYTGWSAGANTTTGSYNSVYGHSALKNNATGAYNAIFGWAAGIAVGSSYSNNSLFGTMTGVALTSGSNNVFVGYKAGYTTTTAGSNTFMGYQAGISNTTGNTNTFVGYNADNASSTTITNAAAFGANTIVRVSNNFLLGDNSTKVGIGLSNDATGALSQLSVNGNGYSQVTGFFKSTNTSSAGACGARGEVPQPSGANQALAVVGVATAGTGYVYGVYGSSTNASSSSGRSYGVYGQAANGTDGYNYGVYGKFTGGSNYFGAAVFGGNNGDVALPQNYAGFFDGLLRTTNDAPLKPTAGSWTGYSDARLKKDVTPFNDGLNVLRNINPVSYKFNGIGNISTTETHIGVIAQDIQPFAPYCISSAGKLVVKTSESSNFSGSEIIATMPADTSGEAYTIVAPLSYNYDGLIYVMINSIKQLDSVNTSSLEKDSIANQNLQTIQDKDSIHDSQIAALQNQVNQLVEALNNCCSSNHSMLQNNNSNSGSAIDVSLKDGQSVILEQNVPNPFAEQTTINYFLPDNVLKAQMLFYNVSGKLIQSVDLTGKGKGSINVFAQDLSNGTYTYTIVVDGKIMETKKMVKQ